MTWPKQLVLVRHAESEGNILSADKRARLNVSTHAHCLTEKGIEQARATGKYLRARFGDFDVYYTSYYVRSQETMKLMYPDAHIYEDPRLAEGQRGIWHTMKREEIWQNFPGEISRKEREGLYHYRAPGGENWPDIELRIHSFLGTLNRDCGNMKVLIVVHAHWLILFQRLVHHFSIAEAVERYKTAGIKNASITLYERKQCKGKPTLVLTEENVTPWERM